MPFDISKYAKGVPAILGLKEKGRGFPSINDQVVGTMDLRELYLLDTRELQGFTGVVAAVGQNLFATQVPPGELWYVWNFQLIALPGVGTAIEMATAAQLDGLNVQVLSDYVSAPASSQVLVRSAGPFWAGPGTVFAAFVKTLTGAVTVGGQAIVTKLRV